MVKALGIHISRWSVLLLLGDIAAFCLAIPVSLVVLALSGKDPWFLWDQYHLPLVLVALTYFLVLYIANLYDHYLDFRRPENISRIILTCLIGTLVAAFLFSFSSWRIIPRNFVEWHAVAFVWLTVLWRYSFSAIALPMRLRRRILILGAGTAGRWIAEIIKQLPNCGLAVVGFVDDDPQKADTTIDGLRVIGQSTGLNELVRREKADLVVLAITHRKTAALLMTLNQVMMGGCGLTDIPNLYEFMVGKIPVDHISDIWLYFNNQTYHNQHYPKIKRLMDLLLAALGLIITAPLLIIIALAIRLDSPGPILFRQRRLGYDAKPFEILKFRTMIGAGSGEPPRWAACNDKRVTRVGGILRRLHFDEIPQLINIFRGEMSLIGPRAEWDVFAHKAQELVPELRPGRRPGDPFDFTVVTQYRERIPYYSYRFLVKPGVTGWAQVMFPYAGSSMQELKEKLEYDLYYVKNMGVLLDLSILLKTIRIVLFGHGK
jgi:exopolysaccharide biosynthesis polyprenyl glycosylphosphotransferase